MAADCHGNGRRRSLVGCGAAPGSQRAPDGRPGSRQPQPGEARAPVPGAPLHMPPPPAASPQTGGLPATRGSGPNRSPCGPPAHGRMTARRQSRSSPVSLGRVSIQLTPDNAEEPRDRDLQGPARQGLEAAGGPRSGGLVSRRRPGELGRGSGGTEPTAPAPSRVRVHTVPAARPSREGRKKLRSRGPQPAVTNVPSKPVSARRRPVWDRGCPGRPAEPSSFTPSALASRWSRPHLQTLAALPEAATYLQGLL